MSISAQHKANNRERKAAGKPERTFAQYKADMERMAAARAARGKSKATGRKTHRIQKVLEQAVPATDMPASVERVSHRVDCFGVNRAGIVTLAVDKADVRKAEKALGSLYCLRGESYVSSGRGERTRLQVQQGQIQKVVKALNTAGLTPAGARGWKRASVTL